MRLVLVGPPGSGKGTQAKLLVDRHQLRSIGTGDILRDAIRRGTPQGKLAEPFLKQGLLAPDDLVNDLVNELFRGANRPEKYVLDGYPRTHAQAVWFETLITDIGSSLTGVVQFEVSDTEVVRRISGRWGCPKCKAVYHTSDKPPKVPGICDLDGERLTQRDDDREEVIRARLKVFHDHTNGLLAYYRQRGLLRVVPSVGSIESIYNTTMSLLHVQA